MNQARLAADIANKITEDVSVRLDAVETKMEQILKALTSLKGSSDTKKVVRAKPLKSGATN
jgi:hypothetical protein